MHKKKVKTEGMDVWIQAKKTKGPGFESEGSLIFSRVPNVGEYFKLNQAADALLYKVTAVIHLPFAGAESRAEVYAVEAGDKEVFK